MAHPTTRVLAALELLQTHGRMSGAELARRLEVDVRTLRRYITILEDVGVPITAERGRHGAYTLVTGFKLPPLMFTEDETLAVSLGLLAARSLGLAQASSAVASAQAKLERVMPAGLKDRVRSVSEMTSLDLTRGDVPHDNAALVSLTTAAQARRRVHLSYRAADGDVTARDVDPYGLIYRQAHWYVGGMCHLRKGLRFFRLDRVQQVRMLSATFDRPDDFDTARLLTRSIATIRRRHRVEVLLHTSLGNALEELHESLGTFEPSGYDVVLHTHTNSIEWFARLLARLSFSFEIREPTALRTALQRHARRLLRQHAPSPASASSHR